MYSRRDAILDANLLPWKWSLLDIYFDGDASSFLLDAFALSRALSILKSRVRTGRLAPIPLLIFVSKSEPYALASGVEVQKSNTLG